jgi:hypothetical protein
MSGSIAADEACAPSAPDARETSVVLCAVRSRTHTCAVPPWPENAIVLASSETDGLSPVMTPLALRETSSNPWS